MKAAVMPLDPVVVDVLREAAAWRLLGRLFECPSAEWRADIAALAGDIADAELAEAAHAALEESSEGLYHSLLGPGGPVPPREVSYHDSLELGSVMSSLTGYYDAFGYRPATLEPPDHVSVEAGFIAYLRTKQACAMAADDATCAAQAANAAERFRRDHLATSATRLAALMTDAPATYLRIAARVLAARVGPRPGPLRLPLVRPVDRDEDDDSTFACVSS